MEIKHLENEIEDLKKNPASVPIQYFNLNNVNKYLENHTNVKSFPTSKFNVSEE